MTDQHAANVCRFLAKEYGVQPYISWGTLTDPVLRKWWDDNGGNATLLSTSSTVQAKPPPVQVVPIADTSAQQPIVAKPPSPTLLCTAYLGSWASPIPRASALSRLDRVCSAFWSLDPAGNVNGRASQAYEQQLSKLGPKILASVGGWGGGSNFSGVFGDGGKRLQAVKSLGGLVYQIGWHGIDIDWEFPSGPADPQSLLAFCQLFKQWYPNLLLTLAVSTDTSYLRGVAGDLSKVVDSFHVMTYDYVGSWTANTGFNSDVVDGAVSVQNYINAGFPAAKLQMGCAWYGRKATVKSMAAQGLGQQALSWDTDLAYSDIAGNYLGKQGWTRTWDAAHSSPWLSNATTSQIITYEDQDASRVKRQWCLDHNLQGIFCWEWSQDDTQSTLASAMTGN